MNAMPVTPAAVLSLAACVLAASAALAVHAPDAASPAPTPATPAAPAPAHSAVTPAPRPDPWWTQRHEAFNARARDIASRGDIDVIFLGDSITEGWGGPGKSAWTARFSGQPDADGATPRAVNFGIGGDRTQHVLWRIQHGNLDGLAAPAAGKPPRLVVLMIGTNNSNGADNTGEEIGDGIVACVHAVHAKLPDARVLLLAIFPRGERPNPQREKNALASTRARDALAADARVRFLDIGEKFLQDGGTLSRDIMPDALHLSPRGYEIWADAVAPVIDEMLAAE